MCCLFGIIDYGQTLSRKQRMKLTHALAPAAEVRGTDASGIAYCSNGSLHISKRPVPDHRLRAKIPEDAHVIMGHTRMATQGDAKQNYNNHPFRSEAKTNPFVLAHNGVIYNDDTLRDSEKLPQTHIKTDSYIAVQLLEQYGRTLL